MVNWLTQGCQHCRQRWESGAGLPTLGISQNRHASLHRCDICSTYWEQHERYVIQISEEEAKIHYAIPD